MIFSDSVNFSVTSARIGNIRRGDESIKFTFYAFQDYVIEGNIECSLKGADLNSSKEVILEILSVLKRVSCSSYVEIYTYYNWN